MKRFLKIGVLAYQGDVIEHIYASRKALKNLRLKGIVIPVRTKSDLTGLSAIIIPGGESTVLHKLSGREGVFTQLKKIKNIFGTCAGAIMLAKKVYHKTADQKTLELMDIEIDRNAYGRQTDSFEKEIQTTLGKINAVFIRAPKIISIGKNVTVLARNNEEIVSWQQKSKNNFYLAACFHPELTTTIFHEYFFRNLRGRLESTAASVVVAAGRLPAEV